ncbi:hypothetical protein N7505_001259 [Penicillium chrysogenum]|uniref:Uncharacterized protein n=1 Tax=Penicillium chrysogenum TaxID=5076 RepID=A0ABQ8WXB9_PENCH|nr:hypothetical protein N7505_001259 [Penicillium chrysogenum]
MLIGIEETRKNAMSSTRVRRKRKLSYPVGKRQDHWAPNAEFHEIIQTPSTKTRENVGARQNGPPGATAAAAGESETVGLLNQPSTSVPASGSQLSPGPQVQLQPRSRDDNVQEQAPQSSDNSSQPTVAEQGEGITA